MDPIHWDFEVSETLKTSRCTCLGGNHEMRWLESKDKNQTQILRELSTIEVIDNYIFAHLWYRYV